MVQPREIGAWTYRRGTGVGPVRGVTSAAVPHYLIATDAEWVLDDVQGALEGPGTTLTYCESGQQVTPSVKADKPDLVILDLQIGTMGGMAVTMDLRLEESGGRLPHVPVLMLLDRTADVFLASRAGAEGWLIKPLDSLRLRPCRADDPGRWSRPGGRPQGRRAPRHGGGAGRRRRRGSRRSRGWRRGPQRLGFSTLYREVAQLG